MAEISDMKLLSWAKWNDRDPKSKKESTTLPQFCFLYSFLKNNFFFTNTQTHSSLCFGHFYYVSVKGKKASKWQKFLTWSYFFEQNGKTEIRNKKSSQQYSYSFVFFIHFWKKNFFSPTPTPIQANVKVIFDMFQKISAVSHFGDPGGDC